MKRLNVPGSSGIVSIGYDKNEKILEIVFVPDKKYHYLNVQSSMYNALLKADSKGAFVNKYIKGRYRYLKIE